MTCPPTSFAAVRRHALALAEAWVAAGAGGCCLHGGAERLVLAGSCEGDVTEQALSGSLRGWSLAVHGPVAAGRLAVDAALLAALADRTNELAETAQALVDTNDQLIAIFGLAESTSSSAVGNDLLVALANDVLRLTDASAVLLAVDGGIRVGAGPDASVEMLDRFADETSPLTVRGDQHGAEFDIVVRPLRGNSDGVLVVAGRAGHRVSTNDLQLIDAVTYFLSGLISIEMLHRAALASAVIERDAATAADLARMVLPSSSPSAPGVDVAARCDPARLAAGDFYTWTDTPDGLVFAVGDVAGKGLGAALVMTMVTAATTRAALASGRPEPSELFASIAAELGGYLSDAAVFVTMLIGVYRPDAGELLVANAGHSPVILRTGGESTMVRPSAPPLGVLPELVTDTVVVPFEIGDVLVVGTDGLAEQQDVHGRQLGYARLVEIVAEHASGSAESIVAALFDEVERFGGDAGRDDDRTALVVRRVEDAHAR